MGNYCDIASSRISDDGQGNKNKKMTPKKGHIVVYVGENMCRFVVPISCLKKPQFQRLLDEAAEVYGFHTCGGIVLPCTESTFFTVVNLEDRQR